MSADAAAPVLALSAAVLVAALWLTGWFRRYALVHRLLDVPNPRSSHAVATPRGGGVAIVLTVLLALPALGALGALPWPWVCGGVGGGALVAALGFADDHRHIPPRWRLLAHFAAAAWVLWWLGGLPALPVLGAARDLGWVGHGLAAVYLVWLLNLTNFMDGIDGIAGIEVVTVCVGGIVLCQVAAPGAGAWSTAPVLSAATVGFLYWNWPPAKIFMGDAGSGFLGLMLGMLSVQAGWVAPQLFWGWVILLGVFVVDATVTLLVRMARRERVYEAHRSHAYQHAALRWGAHRPVTLVVGSINLGWLLPVAVLVARGSLDGVLGVVVAYAPVVAVAIWMRAGRPSPT